MEWSRSPRYLINNLFKLVTNVDSNVALFKDNGIKYINKILLAILPQKDNSKFIEATSMITDFKNNDSDGIEANLLSFTLSQGY